MSFLTNTNTTTANYLNSLHVASQNYVLKTVAASDTLINTNLGLEQSRAQSSENSIASQLTSYISSNNASVATLASSISSVQAKSLVDEALSSGEVTRAEGIEQSLQSQVNTNRSSITTENGRATGAESALSASIATSATAIQAIQVVDAIQTSNILANTNSVASLIASRTTDEASILANTTSIASLNTSRTRDEANIDTNYQSVQTLNSRVAELATARGTDETSIASNSAAIASLNTSRTRDEANIDTNYQSVQTLNSQMTALGSLVTTSQVTAGVVATPFVQSNSGTLTLVASNSQYGTSRLVLTDQEGLFGLMLDNSNSVADASDIILRNSDTSARLRFCKGGVIADHANDSNGDFSLSINGVASFYSGQLASGIINGNFMVKAGTISDVNDLDVTLGSFWSNAFDNVPAEIRLVRKGNMVTVVMQNFSANTLNNTGIAQYNLSVPAWAIPSGGPIQCSVVVSTNGAASAGCATMTSTGLFQIFPFNGTWGNNGGLGQSTAFSYLL